MIVIAAARTTSLGTTTDSPFIAFTNLAATATLGGTAVLADGAASNAVDGNTYDYWLPNVTTTTCNFRVTFAAARTISFVGIAAHNIFTYGANAKVQRSTDGGTTWADAGAGTVTPTDNSPIGFRMITTGNDAADWRILISGLTAGNIIQVGVALFGDDLVFPQRIYQGFAPVITPTEVDLQSNVSVGGNLLGSSVVRRGSTMAASFANIDPAFARSSMPALMTHFNAGNGVFFGWRPAKYPQDLHYGWRQGETIRPANSATLDMMAFNLSMRVHER